MGQDSDMGRENQHTGFLLRGDSRDSLGEKTQTQDNPTKQSWNYASETWHDQSRHLHLLARDADTHTVHGFAGLSEGTVRNTTSLGISHAIQSHSFNHLSVQATRHTMCLVRQQMLRYISKSSVNVRDDTNKTQISVCCTGKRQDELEAS